VLHNAGMLRRALSQLAILLGCSAWGCSVNGQDPGTPTDAMRAARERMVKEQLESRDIRDPRVLDAMRRVPRHELVPESLRDQAYQDRALPIGLGQTISQPYVVAFMSQAAEIHEGDKVLEIGTGSGYQAAVLVAMGARVYTIEYLPELAERARRDLARIGYAPAGARAGDGYGGWPEQAPFDAILVTAAPDHVPPALVEQLAVGGRMVLPVGSWSQDLVRLRKTERGIEREVLLPVRFVPMRGEAERRDDER
jgi:protein-L-isoaspartate(D-aspartate) O-methyltransferase